MIAITAENMKRHKNNGKNEKPTRKISNCTFYLTQETLTILVFIQNQRIDAEITTTKTKITTQYLVAIFGNQSLIIG